MTKLLIVDDSSLMRANIGMHLKDQNVEIVGAASNGKEALEMVKKFKPDVVTLDITMPEMDGLECLSEIMNVDPKVKIMMITALSDKLTALRALNKGARGYVFKPVNSEELKKAFTKLVNRN